jgi:hypothetical protein
MRWLAPLLQKSLGLPGFPFGTSDIPVGFCSVNEEISSKENPMTRYLIGAAVAVLLSASPLLAADTTQPTNPQPTNPPAGTNAAGGDTSSGAKEQSSAPPGSPAESDLSTKSSTGASGDTSKGAKEQSSAPPGSTAATGQPNSSSDTSNSPSGTMKPSQP